MVALRRVYLLYFQLLCVHAAQANGLLTIQQTRSSSALDPPLRRSPRQRHRPHQGFTATTTFHSIHRFFSPRLAARRTLRRLYQLRSVGGTDGDNNAGPPSKTSSSPPSSSSSSLWREMAAEAFGTYLIVQLGTGAVMASIFTQSMINLTQIALVWAVAVTIAIYSTASVSGAHLNPAITLALALYRHFSWRKVLPYSLAQLVGAGLGSVVNYILFAHHIRAYETAHRLVRSTAVASARAFGEYFTGVSAVTALLAEAAGTFVLAFVIFALTHPSSSASSAPPQKRQRSSFSCFWPSQQLVPVAIGATVGLIICVVAPVTQAGLNPARDLGPRLVAYWCGWRHVAFTGAWVYIFGPILGATAGGYVVDRVLLYDGKSSKSPSESDGSSNVENG